MDRVTPALFIPVGWISDSAAGQAASLKSNSA